MPGIPLSEVRYVKGLNAWLFPRLYVDGSSWLWEFAINMARGDLADPDGAIEIRIRATRVRCTRRLNKEPRCPVCQTVLILRHGRGDGRHGEGDYSIECLGCNPVVVERRETPDGAVYLDDGWKTKPHYFARLQEMAPEAPGHDDPDHPDALCGALGYRNEPCRLRRRHAGHCERYWRVIERTIVDPPRDLASGKDG